jgi:TM2 domain-containing membrane protein YozV
MALSASQLMLIEQRVTNEGPSAGVAWLLYFFTWFLGGHRFYLGRTGSAIVQLLTFGGFFIWAFIDLFLLSGMIRARRDEIRQKLIVQILASGEAAEQPGAAAA